jgi:hypothetical protein
MVLSMLKRLSMPQIALINIIDRNDDRRDSRKVNPKRGSDLSPEPPVDHYAILPEYFFPERYTAIYKGPNLIDNRDNL